MVGSFKSTSVSEPRCFPFQAPCLAAGELLESADPQILHLKALKKTKQKTPKKPLFAVHYLVLPTGGRNGGVKLQSFQLQQTSLPSGHYPRQCHGGKAVNTRHCQHYKGMEIRDREGSLLPPPPAESVSLPGGGALSGFYVAPFHRTPTLYGTWEQEKSLCS